MKGYIVANIDFTKPTKTVTLVKGGGPAVDLSTVRDAGHIDLAKRADKAGIVLSKFDLTGIRAQVRLYIDHSGSMEWPDRRYYSRADKPMQGIVDAALGFSFQIDVDGKIPVFAFDSKLWSEVEVDVNNYRGIVDRSIWRPRDMGGTKYSVVLRDIKQAALASDAPIFAIIVTDGDPGDPDLATQLVCELAGYPVFLKFLALEEVAYLRRLDEGEDERGNTLPRLLDNVDAKYFDGTDTPLLSNITPMQFAEAMVDEWNTWIKAASAAGVLN